MKKICVLLALSISGFLNAQSDSAEIYQVYEDFESTVKHNQSQQLINLFATRQAPVYIVKKNATGPGILGLWGAQQFANSQSGSNNQELQISDIKLHSDPNFAITDARFDELYGTNPSSFGRDLFGYIRTKEGWKLLFLHNTVVLVNDQNDYTTPFDLPNTIEGLIEEFENHYNSQNLALGDLFMRMDNQVIVYNDTLDEDYHYSENEIRDFLLEMSSNPSQKTIAFTNSKTYVVDDYLASVFADYSIKQNGIEIEKGRSYITMMGTITNGWQITSWVRDLEPIPGAPTGMLEKKSIAPKLLPNPASSYVKVDWGTGENIKWNLIHLGTGKTELSGSSKSKVDEIDTSSLPQGTYLLAVESDNEKFGPIRLVKTAN